MERLVVDLEQEEGFECVCVHSWCLLGQRVLMTLGHVQLLRLWLQSSLMVFVQ